MENLSAHKPLSKSHQSYHQYRSFTALKTLFPAHFLAHSSLTEAVHFLLAAKLAENLKTTVNQKDTILTENRRN